LGVIKLKSEINPFALETAMHYRGVSIGKLCKDMNISKFDLLDFFKGYYAVIPEQKLREVMKYLDFPFEFLHSNIKPIKILF